MSSGRSPSQLLAELGADLEAAYRRDDARRFPRWFSSRTRRGRRRALIVVIAVTATGVSTAAATRSLLSSSPPVPLLAPLGINVAEGTAGGVPWTLSVSRCSRPAGSASVVLRAGSGGSGTRCGAAVQPPGVFYDGLRGEAFAFGLLPADTARIELVLGSRRRDVAPVALDEAGRRAARLGPRTVAYVVALPGTAAVTALAAFDGGGHLTLVCQHDSCTQP